MQNINRKVDMKLKTLLVYSLIIWLVGVGTSSSGQNSLKKIGVGYSSRLFIESEIRDTKVALDSWVKELAKSKNVTFELKADVFDEINEFVEAIKNNEIQMVVLYTYDFLELRKKIPLRPALFGTNNGSATEKFILLVNKNTDLKTLNQLKGKRLVLQSNGKGEIARLWIETILHKQKFPNINNYFGDVRLLSKEAQVIFQVFFNQADACIVSSRTFETISELNPQIKDKLIPILVSPGYVSVLFATSENMDTDVKEIIISTALNVEKYPSGKQLLLFFKMDGLIPASDSDLKSIEMLMQEYNTFLQKKYSNKNQK
jgi:ABC-type phosphate/phosphonate transport system substrate-binding protein